MQQWRNSTAYKRQEENGSKWKGTEMKITFSFMKPAVSMICQKPVA